MSDKKKAEVDALVEVMCFFYKAGQVEDQGLLEELVWLDKDWEDFIEDCSEDHEVVQRSPSLPDDITPQSVKFVRFTKDSVAFQFSVIGTGSDDIYNSGVAYLSAEGGAETTFEGYRDDFVKMAGDRAWKVKTRLGHPNGDSCYIVRFITAWSYWSSHDDTDWDCGCELLGQVDMSHVNMKG
jgi:hypothetical protein